MPKIWSVAVAIMTALSVPARAQNCAGDCTGDGAVTVDEIVLSVNIALGARGTNECANADIDQDGAVHVNEIISAVNSALCGCGQACPTPNPTSIPPTVTPTPEFELADAVAAVAVGALPGANQIAAFVVAPGAALRQRVAVGGGPQTNPCPQGGTIRPFCIDTGGTSTVTADLNDCAIQRAGLQIRATGRIAAIQPVGCQGALPPNASVSVSMSAVAIATTNLSTGDTVDAVVSLAGEVRFRTDGSIATGFAGGTSADCLEFVSLQAATFLVSPAGSLCPTSGDLRIRTMVTPGANLIPNLIRFTAQGADIDVGEDGSFDRTAVPCGPPADLACQ